MAKRICNVVTSTFKSLYFKIFTKNYCRKIMDDTCTIVEIVPDESKLIYAINIFMPLTSKKLRGHIGFGLSVPIHPFVTLFVAYHAC